ncbi:MAG: hypothetical protein RLZZ386_1046 [Planctomycetota bacterium]|jgi:hypothetical protein
MRDDFNRRAGSRTTTPALLLTQTRTRVIEFLVEVGLLPADRPRMLRSWVHSGFQVF